MTPPVTVTSERTPERDTTGQVTPSEELLQMLRERRGYRCESFGGNGSDIAVEVFVHEVDELDNIDYIQKAVLSLGRQSIQRRLPRGELAYLEGYLLFPADHVDALNFIRDAVVEEIKARFGPDAVSIWLGTRETVKENYCEPKEEPAMVLLSAGAFPLIDNGYEGVLWVRRYSPGAFPLKRGQR